MAIRHHAHAQLIGIGGFLIAGMSAGGSGSSGDCASEAHLSHQLRSSASLNLSFIIHNSKDTVSEGCIKATRLVRFRQ